MFKRIIRHATTLTVSIALFAAQAGSPTNARAAQSVRPSAAVFTHSTATATPASQYIVSTRPAATAPSAGSNTPTGHGRASAPSGLPLPVTDVTAYGAVGDGHTDSTAAIARAVAVAEARGGTLYFPVGHYMAASKQPNGSAIQVHSGTPLTVAGAGAGLVTLTASNRQSALLSIKVDHTVVQDLTLDTQSTNARQALGIGANYVTVQRCNVLGGSQFFAIYAPGPPGATPQRPQYNLGNRMLDLVINDQLSGDGFSWSFQQSSLIENIDHTGSRLALYVDSNVDVENYTYHPGSQRANQGFWISAPTDHITIGGFTTYGTGGVMTANHGLQNTDIAINGERFLGTGKALRIDGAVRLTITGCDFGANNTLMFSASIPMSSIVVQNCTSLPIVRFQGHASIGAAFNNDNFPAFSASGPSRTFFNWDGGGVAVNINGGSWENRGGGFSGGQAATYTVSHLAGYN